MHAAFVALLAFLGGTIVSYALVLFGGVGLMSVMGIHDRDGGGAMGLAFIIAPAGALIGGVAAVFIALAWRGRRLSAVSGPAVEPAPASSAKRLALVALAALVGFLAASYVVRQMLWTFGPPVFLTRERALVFVWTPTIVGLVGAIALGWAVSRRV